MPRSDADHALRSIRRQFWLIGLVFTIGCAYSKSELQDRLARRVVPVEAGGGRSASPPEVEDQRPGDERHERCDSPPPRNLPRRPRPARITIDPARYHRRSKARHVARILIGDAFASDVASE